MDDSLRPWYALMHPSEHYTVEKTQWNETCSDTINLYNHTQKVDDSIILAEINFHGPVLGFEQLRILSGSGLDEEIVGCLGCVGSDQGIISSLNNAL
jgi:hypothetical protein